MPRRPEFFLTKRTVELLARVHGHWVRYGKAPSTGWLAAWVELSRQTVHYHLRILVDEGYLTDRKAASGRGGGWQLTPRAVNLLSGQVAVKVVGKGKAW